jgi:hypothetical protein
LQNIVVKELQLVTNPGFNILLIPICCLLTPEKALCPQSDRIFLRNHSDYNFLDTDATSLVGALPTGTKFNQDYFIRAIFPGLSNEKKQISRKKVSPFFQFTWEIR